MNSDGSLERIAATLATAIAAAIPASAPLFFGISGPQGTGKSTLAALLRNELETAGRSCALLSLDDFYLPRADRDRLARDVHPLCAVRGVPGTHDAAALLRTMRALHAATADTRIRYPRFSKAADDRLPDAEWHEWRGAPAVVLLEGWCVGAQPAPADAWRGPINAREAREDPDGRWWRWSNAALARDYPECWSMLDLLCGMLLDDFGAVIDGRLRQERDNVRAQPGARPLSYREIVEFTSLFERLTRELQAALPGKADYLIRRDAAYHFTLA